MQIGEFAAVCGTKISVLRHYDKVGILRPDYIDRFSGYRYYSKEQISVFYRISALKKAGFSLADIKGILTSEISDETILHMFEDKMNEYLEKIENLKEAREIMLGVNNDMNVYFEDQNEKMIARTSKIDGNLTNEAIEILDGEILKNGCMRVSGFKAMGEQHGGDIILSCEVVKLHDECATLLEDIDLPFVDDEAAVGRWKTVGEFYVKEDFYAGRNHCGETNEEIYFLPGGERYWCFGWTAGSLLIETGDTSSVNNYTIEEYNNKTYMFVDFKSYNYRRSGRTTVWVLEKADSNLYTAESIAVKEQLNIPFTDDERVLGKWTAHSFILNKSDFSEQPKDDFVPYFKSIEFFNGGICVSIYDDEVISGDNMQTWTRGYVLRHFNNTACKYEICEVNGNEYLIIEWKSGDYRWGGFDTDYYVFIREN